MTTLRQKQERGARGGAKVYVALCRRLLTFERRERQTERGVRSRKMEKVRNGVTTRDGKERGREIGQKAREGEWSLLHSDGKCAPGHKR